MRTHPDKPNVGSSLKKGGVVESVESNRHIESIENWDLSRINGVYDIISQFERKQFL